MTNIQRMIDEPILDPVPALLAVMAKGDNRFQAYAGLVWDALTPAQRDVLRQLVFQGPVWDGCIVCKSSRKQLIEWGLAVRVVFMGGFGYTAAAPDALEVFKQSRAEAPAAKPGCPA